MPLLSANHTPSDGCVEPTWSYSHDTDSPDYAAPEHLLLRVRPPHRGAAAVKWMEDKLIGGAMFILLLPLMLLIGILVRLDSPGPVLFRQPRPGLNNNIFYILKFRTMRHDRCDLTGRIQAQHDDERVTRVGRILRPTGLDELPQFVNVLRGDMSLVGPRPHPVAMTVGGVPCPEAVAGYLGRVRVRPGITGLAQVRGNYGPVHCLANAEERVRHDLEYIECWTVWLDLAILFRTLVLPLRALKAMADPEPERHQEIKAAPPPAPYSRASQSAARTLLERWR